MGDVPPERWSPVRRRRTAVPPNGWPEAGAPPPLRWVPAARIPADDVAAPRRSRPVPEPEPAPRRPWRREQPDRPRGRYRRPRGKRARWLVRLVAAAAVVPAVVMLPLRWIDPPTTAFMAANPSGAVQQSLPIEHVSRNFLAAVIAHEDS